MNVFNHDSQLIIILLGVILNYETASCKPETCDSASYEFVSSWVVNWTICVA